MKTVNALHKGLGILRLLNERGVCQIRHLHEATGMPKPTILRMLGTLAEAGYVSRDAESGYGVTAKVRELASGYDAKTDLLRAAKPVLDKLRKECAWPVNLAIFDHDAMMIADTGKTSGIHSINSPVGTRLSATITALGRSYLAFLPEDEAARILSSLAKRGELASGGMDQMIQQLALVRRKGHAICNQELARTTRAVAAPILAGGKPVGAINMTAATQVLSMKKAEAIFAPLLKRAAKRIADHLAEQPA
jgi:IclR family mhp operon transcriptional activator